VSRNTNYVYDAESIGGSLVRWLNAGGDRLRRRDVVDLIDIARKYSNAKPAVKPLLQAKANAILLAWAFSPIIDDMDDRGWKIEWIAKRGGVGGQANAILTLLDLAEAGLIDSLRRCEWKECGKWFIARFKHQRFDVAEHRILALQTDPARKEQRARKMRQLRRTKKEMLNKRKRKRRK